MCINSFLKAYANLVNVGYATLTLVSKKKSFAITRIQSDNIIVFYIILLCPHMIMTYVFSITLWKGYRVVMLNLRMQNTTLQSSLLYLKYWAVGLYLAIKTGSKLVSVASDTRTRLTGKFHYSSFDMMFVISQVRDANELTVMEDYCRGSIAGISPIHHVRSPLPIILWVLSS